MSYVFFLVILFIALLIAGVFALLRYQRARQKKLATDQKLFIKVFGKPFTVPLASCNIAHRQFEVEGKMVDVCMVTFETDAIGGHDMLFKSQPIYSTVDALQKNLHQKRTAKLYYNPDNVDQYFFDIDF